MILKTYARLFVTDLDRALPLYETLVGRPADLRFGFEAAELAAVGDLLIVAGPPEATDRYRGTVGPLVVADLDALRAQLADSGATVTHGPESSATGRFLYARHPDGVLVEYVEWSPEVRERVLGTG
ncbi:VOC family protein [Nocardia sp. NPDC057353]|uniref:VOC family protein n=1 Tax=Nocardia sp. NPDC057353 TaxID=3346104 RepID=UPI003643BB75